LGAGIVQFDKLQALKICGSMVEDFIDDNISVGRIGQREANEDCG